jgi:glucose/arabinose dehydrogenase
MLARMLPLAAAAALLSACSGSGSASSPAGVPASAPRADAERAIDGIHVVFPAARTARVAPDATSVGGPYWRAVVADTPAAYFRLGETASATAADSSGNGHTAAVSSTGVREGATPLVAGDPTTAMRFTGERSGYVAAARNAAFEPASAVTVELWAKIAPVDPPVAEGLALYGVSASAVPHGYGLKYNYDRIVFKLALSSPSGPQSIVLQPSSGLGVNPTPATPYYVAGTYDGSTAKLYVNAQLVASQAVTGALVYDDPSGTVGLVVGNNVPLTAPAWAALQDVAVYPRALSAASIAAHYASATAPSPAPTADPRLTVPAGFHADKIATVGSARELAVAPNGDLLVGTQGTAIDVVPSADGPGVAGAPRTLITLAEGPAHGIALGAGALYAATNTAVWKIPYTAGDLSETSATKIASVRTGPVAPNSDGDVHRTTSVAVSGSTVYAGVGSSCNACTETDPTRATIQRMGLSGQSMTTLATRIRNPIALAIDPATGALWAGGAGQDNIPASHPFEFLDAVTSHGVPPIDYGWPVCEENHHAYTTGANCANTVAPLVELPAYSTIIGATFYPLSPTGPYAFPAGYRGGLFVSAHGSWHTANGKPVDPPHVVFVAMNGDTPLTAVNWNDPTAQWSEFFGGFQDASGARIGRVTGIAVGPNGSLFVADDQTGNIYRIRPGAR